MDPVPTNEMNFALIEANALSMKRGHRLCERG